MIIFNALRIQCKVVISAQIFKGFCIFQHTHLHDSPFQSAPTPDCINNISIFQKTFCTDFLTKKMKKNEGEVPQYYVEGSHSPILSAELFDHVQCELKRRKGIGNIASTSCFSGRIVCGDCGSIYGNKVWHSTSKYRRVIWQCN